MHLIASGRSAGAASGRAAFLAAAALLSCLAHGAPVLSDPGLRAKLETAVVPFVANKGQWSDQAAFAARTFAGTVVVTKEGQLVYNLPGRPVAAPSAPAADAVRPVGRSGPTRPVERTAGWVLTETFVDDARQPLAATPGGGRPSAAKVSSFVGSDERRHQRDLDTYERVRLGEVFPGVEVDLRATGSNVEKIFTVAPGQDPARIRLRIGGATGLELGAAGELVVHTGNGALRYTAPVAFQEDGQGRHEPVAVRYALDARSGDYGFALGRYDTARPLVIDPLLQSTYIGGGLQDYGEVIAVHPVSGDVYVAGSTGLFSDTGGANGLPGTAAGVQPVFGGVFDGFISRFSADLTRLVQSTYLGSGAWDDISALVIHPVSGEVFIAGRTGATGGSFPGVSGGAQATSGGGTDAFVARLGADLKTLIQSTYLGAAGTDQAAALAIHPVSGEVYVAGYTDASGGTFPGASGGAQKTFGGGQSDGFISRFSADLKTLLRSTYLGGSDYDSAGRLAIHPSTGDVYVAGTMGTAGTAFPGTAGGAQGACGGNQDAFVSRLSADLGTLFQSICLGGPGTDSARDMIIHPANGDIYIAGMTQSPGSTFPGVSGGAQGKTDGSWDGFVTRLNPGLTRVIQSTYLGGPAATM